MSSANTLAIRRLVLRVEAQEGHGAVVAQRAAESARTALPRTLQARLGALTSESDPAVLLLRRVEIDLNAPALAGLDALATRLADALTAALGKALTEHAGSVRFADRGSHTGAFLGALVAGRAWDHWWFRGFEGVRALPLSAAIRTVLARDWATAPRVLAALPDGARGKLIEALATADINMILNGIAGTKGESLDARAWEALAGAIVATPQGTEEQVALSLIATMAASVPEAVGGALVPTVRAAAAVVRALADPAQAPAVAERLAASDTDGRAPDALAGAVHVLPPPVRALINTLRIARPTDAETKPRPASNWRYTALGGHALLLPSLLRLEPDAAITGWPDPAPRVPAGSLLRALVLAGAAGSERGPALLADPVWRDLFGLPGPLLPGAVTAWTRAVGPRRWRSLATALGLPEENSSHAIFLPNGLIAGRFGSRTLGALSRHILAHFARRLPGFASISPAHLRTNLFCAGALIRNETREIVIRLERPPLDVLLSLSGAAAWSSSWTDGRALHLERIS